MVAQQLLQQCRLVQHRLLALTVAAAVADHATATADIALHRAAIAAAATALVLAAATVAAGGRHRHGM